IDEAQAIHEEARAGRRGVFVGAGYLNVEVAGGCLLRGCQVTILEMGDRPWGRLASMRLGDFLTGYFEGKGARFRFGEQVSGFGGNGRVAVVETRSGQAIPADFVVVA